MRTIQELELDANKAKNLVRLEIKSLLQEFTDLNNSELQHLYQEIHEARRSTYEPDTLPYDGVIAFMYYILEKCDENFFESISDQERSLIRKTSHRTIPNYSYLVYLKGEIKEKIRRLVKGQNIPPLQKGKNVPAQSFFSFLEKVLGDEMFFKPKK